MKVSPFVYTVRGRTNCIASVSHLGGLQLQPRLDISFWFELVPAVTSGLGSERGKSEYLAFSDTSGQQCIFFYFFADNFLCVSRAMENLDDNTTVISTLRSFNNFISQRIEGMSGQATPGSSQNSLQMQYQQRVQVRCP